MANPKTDDLEAVRTVIEAIVNFKPEEQQRIFRWVAEKLGLPQPFASTVQAPPPTVPPPVPHPAGSQVTPTDPNVPPTGSIPDIRTFIAAKRPRNDIQFAAAVAYYYRFEAQPSERKEIIDKDDLQEAARKAGRERFAKPIVTLFNAHKLGLLDKGTEKATFTINSVGENLVAMTLPDGTTSGKPAKKKVVKSVVKKAPVKKAKKA